MVFSLGQNTWNKHTKNHLFHSTERSAVTLGAKAAGLLDTRFSSPQKGRTCMILQDSNTFSIPEQKISLGPKNTINSCSHGRKPAITTDSESYICL